MLRERTMKPSRFAATAVAIASTAATIALADWVPQDLQASPALARSAVGASIAIFQSSAVADVEGGNRAVMWAGAPFATGAAADSGMVHAWRYQPNPGMQWVYAFTLASGLPRPGAAFGAAVAWGRTVNSTGYPSTVGFLLVGSPRAPRVTGSVGIGDQCAGYAEAFAMANVMGAPTSGTPVSLPHPSPQGGDLYGAAVATTLAANVAYAMVSAPLDDRIVDGTTYMDAGTVQCFRRDAATTFTYVGEAAAPTATANDRFGEALCASGSRFYARVGSETPRVAVFRFDAGVPVFESYVNYPGSDTAALEGFGTAIACDGTFLAVGGPGPGRSGPGVGRVWVFDAAPPFALRTVVESPFPSECAGFGSAVALERGTLVVGTAEGESSLLAGMASAYSLEPMTAVATTLFVEADTEGAESGFGCVVASSGLHVAIGAPTKGSGIEGGVRTVTSRPAPRTPDLNHDGVVNGTDLGLLLGMFRTASPSSQGDFNYDWQVNGLDLGILLGAWGTVP